MLYIAIRLGVYRHGIVCCSADLEKVVKTATRAIEEESDHYHDMEIVQLCEGEKEVTLFLLSWMEYGVIQIREYCRHPFDNYGDTCQHCELEDLEKYRFQNWLCGTCGSKDVVSTSDGGHICQDCIQKRNIQKRNT